MMLVVEAALSLIIGVIDIFRERAAARREKGGGRKRHRPTKPQVW